MEKYPTGTIPAVDLRKAYVAAIDAIDGAAISYNKNSKGLQMNKDDTYLAKRFIRENFPFLAMCDTGAMVKDVSTSIVTYVRNLKKLSDVYERAEKELGLSQRHYLLTAFFGTYARRLGANDTICADGDYFDNIFNKVYKEVLEEYGRLYGPKLTLPVIGQP